jgi:hypothetical protein
LFGVTQPFARLVHDSVVLHFADRPWRKRICIANPGAAGGEFGIAQQAGVECVTQGSFIHVDADHHQFLLGIAIGFNPAIPDDPAVFFILRPFRLGNPPQTAQFVSGYRGQPATNCRPDQGARRGQPEIVLSILDFLIEQGLAHKIGRMNLFVACRHASHQIPSLFLVCPQCSGVTELQEQWVMSALSTSLAEAGHRLESPEVEISALCPKCVGVHGHRARIS